jgi:hypothetical protein
MNDADESKPQTVIKHWSVKKKKPSKSQYKNRRVAHAKKESQSYSPGYVEDNDGIRIDQPATLSII